MTRRPVLALLIVSAALAFVPAPFLRCIDAQVTATQATTTQPEARDPLAEFTREWRDNAAWNERSVEFAVYEATRTIDGKAIKYNATIRTNKEFADPVTGTRNPENKGREAFRVTLDEALSGDPAARLSTMLYVGTTDLKSLKIAIGWLEASGTTFKQIINHKGTLTWTQFSPRPNEGYKTASYDAPRDLVFVDALPTVLRGYPFQSPPGQMMLRLLEKQAAPRLTSVEPQSATIDYIGKETLELPYGAVPVHHLMVIHAPGNIRTGLLSRPDAKRHDYWFAANAQPPLLRIMVQYEGPDGTAYRLKSVERKPAEQD